VLLSDNAVLVFVLRRSGCVGQLKSGRVERLGKTELEVYTGYDAAVNDYISGGNLRSWGVLGLDGELLPGWHEITVEDVPKITQ
jgi:hypothetical protein